MPGPRTGPNDEASAYPTPGGGGGGVTAPEIGDRLVLSRAGVPDAASGGFAAADVKEQVGTSITFDAGSFGYDAVILHEAGLYHYSLSHRATPAAPPLATPVRIFADAYIGDLETGAEIAPYQTLLAQQRQVFVESHDVGQIVHTFTGRLPADTAIEFYGSIQGAGISDPSRALIAVVERIG